MKNDGFPGMPLDGSSAGAEPMSNERMAELTELAIRLGADARRRTAVGRHRRVAIAAALALALSTGTAAAAAVLFKDRPDNVTAGVACRSSVEAIASEVVLEVSSDPITACRDVWASGELEEFVGDPSTLTACLRPGGSYVVIPGDSTGCRTLGFSVATGVLDDESLAIAELGKKIREAFNSQSCLNAEEAVTWTKRTLADLGLADWIVLIDSNGAADECARIGIQPSESLLTISVNQRKGR